MLVLEVMNWVHNDISQVASSIASKISQRLDTGPVTWFVSGGSNVALQAHTMELLKLHPKLSDLTALLIDERFGIVGHPDSNWKQLSDAGFMTSGPTYIAPFTERTPTLMHAVQRYEGIIDDALNGASFCFAQLGMGDDGHVSGILPDSTAATAADSYVFGYEQAPYQRLTTTFRALQDLDEIVMVAYGQSKWPQLAKLTESIDKVTQPVQILKEIPTVTIYTDYQI